MSEQREPAISRDEAVEQLKAWAGQLQVDTDAERFEDVVKELALPVMHERMSFDRDAETFTYQLLAPIRHENSADVEMVTISEMSYKQSQKLDKYKENESVLQSQALIAESTGLAIGEVAQLKNRDIRKINAVILGFFA